MRVSLKQKFKSTALTATATLLALLLAGCGSRNAVKPGIAGAGPTGPWFCEPASDGADWDCTDDPSRVANPRPSQPLARVLAAREAAEAATRAATAPMESVDLPGDSPVTTLPGTTAATQRAAMTAPPAATATARTPGTTAAPTAADDADAAEPAYARLAYRPEQPVSLLDLPPNFYAVQIIALETATELERFFEQLGVNSLTAAEVEVDGDLHYVLLLGVYETFAAAEQAAANPPAALETYDPWIRRLGSLQAAMVRADRRRQ